MIGTNEEVMFLYRLAVHLTTFGCFSVGATENTNQVFQPDDRFWAANSQ